MFEYFKRKIDKKIARRVTKKYPTRIDNFETHDFGNVKFANWENPLVKEKILNQSNIEFFQKFLSKGDTALDIGANIGHMTIPMSYACGKEGLVMAFDPNPFVFEILTQNIALNPDSTHIIANNFAITETDGDFFYNSSEASFNNGGISSEKVNRHGKYSLETKIKGVHLKKYLSESYPEQLNKLKLIKIDTEGYDIEIIKSISDLLLEFKPAVITECFGRNPEAKKFEQFEILTSLGYQLFYFSDFVGDATIEPIKTKEDMLKVKHFDLYAIHSSQN
jgi:FkbM family methyltransferase